MTTLTTSFFPKEVAVSCMRRDADRRRKSRKKGDQSTQTDWNETNQQKSLEQIDLDLKAKMEYEQNNWVFLGLLGQILSIAFVTSESK